MVHGACYISERKSDINAVFDLLHEGITFVHQPLQCQFEIPVLRCDTND